MYRIITRLFAALVLFAMYLPSAHAQANQLCFPETGQCISGRIQQFWEQNGRLKVFGFPVAPQAEELVEGKPLQVQWFERNRLELHPENTAPYDVLLGRLGVDRLAQQNRDWFSFPKGSEQAGCRLFAETGHTVCADILAAWRASGLEIDGRTGKTEAENLALFGLPLSEAAVETNASGATVLTQWFERARFEVYPDNASPYRVQFGLLGNEIRAGGNLPAPQPQPPSGPQPIVLQGRGAQVTDPITTPGAYAKVTSRHTGGSSNFIVYAYWDDQEDLVANLIGEGQESRALPGGKSVRFEVKADGDWTITVEPLAKDQNAAQTFSGSGSQVSGLFNPPARGNVAYAFAHDGTENFIVYLHCGTDVDLVANEIGATSGSGFARFQNNGPCYWEVLADGTWSMSRQ